MQAVSRPANTITRAIWLEVIALFNDHDPGCGSSSKRLKSTDAKVMKFKAFSGNMPLCEAELMMALRAISGKYCVLKQNF